MKYYKYLILNRIKKFKVFIESEYKGYYLSRKFLYSEFEDPKVKFSEFFIYYFSETNFITGSLIHKHVGRHVTNHFIQEHKLTNFILLDGETKKFSSFILIV